MTDKQIIRTTNAYKKLRDILTPEEISMLSTMLYNDVLTYNSNRIKADEEVKLQSYRERTSWVKNKV